MALFLSGCSLGGETDSLTVLGTAPAEGETWGANAPLSVRFDRYLATVPVASPAVTLFSAETPVPIGLLYDPVDRALVVRPTEELVPGVAYVLTVASEAIVGLDGARLDEPFELRFVAVAGGAGPVEPAVDFERDVAPIFQKRCSCHGPAPAQRPALEPDALVDVPGARPGEGALVAPGDPLGSVLVRKVLPGYPGQPGGPMPPDGPLSGPELRLLVDWIKAL